MIGHLVDRDEREVYHTCTPKQLRALHYWVNQAFDTVIGAVDSQANELETTEYFLAQTRRSLVLLHMVIQGIGPEEPTIEVKEAL